MTVLKKLHSFLIFSHTRLSHTGGCLATSYAGWQAGSGEAHSQQDISDSDLCKVKLQESKSTVTAGVSQHETAVVCSWRSKEHGVNNSGGRQNDDSFKKRSLLHIIRQKVNHHE